MAVAVLLLLPGCSRSNLPKGGIFYKRMSIDPASLVVTFHDPIPTHPHPKVNFYWPFYGHDGHCSLDHWDTTTEPRIRYNSFHLDERDRITSRSKHQLLVREGFGSFYAETSYFYADIYGEKNTSFYVYAYSNSLGSEPPRISDTLIPDHAPLSAVSVIRVFDMPDGQLLTAATYAPDGSLLSVAENRCASGDCRLGGVISFELTHSTLGKFGFLRSFPVADYLHGLRDIFVPTELLSKFDCVSFHYDRNRYVRQDVLYPSESVRSRTLTYQVTPEDMALDPIDKNRIFALRSHGTEKLK